MKSVQWGYFEVGVYGGKPADRKQVLKDFKLGRLDVGQSCFVDHID
jgi:DNA excision repair protein ERCC-6-like 2